MHKQLNLLITFFYPSFIKAFFVNNFMKKPFYFSILFVSLISCAKNRDPFVDPINNVDSSDTSKNNSMDSFKTYLALGDSYTIGQSVPDSERFPVQVVNVLRGKNITIKDPDIIAVTGWTTSNLLNALNNHPPAQNYSLVTLLIGVNNQYQRKNLDAYQTEFIELLNRSVAYAGGIKDHVFVLSIPDYSVTPFAYGQDTARIAKEIDAFNAANKTISLNAGVHYIDITPISRNAKNDPSLIAPDGLHPSGIQYKEWTDLLIPGMYQQLH